MGRVHGVILRRKLTEGLEISPQTARQLSEAFIDNLAALHSLDYAAIGLADLGKPQGYLARQVKGWTERYHGSKNHDLAEVEKISVWLAQRMPPQSDATLVHNDYKYDNMTPYPPDITKIKVSFDC